MTSVQERLQLKREPLDKWSVREQLCLASAVARSGDQNWMSVSRSLKPFGESNRPADWFHQKNCAAQYGALLSNVETPKRKKKTSGIETGVETPAECILKRLLFERQSELKKLLTDEKTEYQKLQEDMRLLQAGIVTEDQLDKWCKEIDEEELKREKEAFAYAQWLRQRDLKKQEIERAWRPLKPSFLISSQKRNLSDISVNFLDTESDEASHVKQAQHFQLHLHQTQQPQSHPQQQSHLSQTPVQIQQVVHVQPQEHSKPALSPLLTSLLKSPSQVSSVSSVSSTILHNVIANAEQKTMSQGPSTNPTIASLLSTSVGVTVPETLQQLVTTAIGQDTASNIAQEEHNQPLDAILDEANLKIDDLASSILVQDGPLPEIKKEEVDDIISEIIDNAQDIVADPEQHLELDGNGDININLELDDLDEEVLPEVSHKNDIKELPKTLEVTSAPSTNQIVDPFEFQEDPVIFESPVKPSSVKQDNTPYVPLYQQQSSFKHDDLIKRNMEKPLPVVGTLNQPGFKEFEECKAPKQAPGSVEIIEVIAEADDNEKELNKSQIETIVYSALKENTEQLDTNRKEEMTEKLEAEVKDSLHKKNETKLEQECLSTNPDHKTDMSVFGIDANIDLLEENDQKPTISSNFADDIYDINMEVKIDKTGKTKRDYSRLKKREEKSLDLVLPLERSQFSEDIIGSNCVDGDNKIQSDKRLTKSRAKLEGERSISPWAEEDDAVVKCSKRRFSAPGTPVDSLPNSPASSVACYDDDKDYKNWKKSVMLVYNRLASNKYASLFLKPITEEQAPGYNSVVYRPMDLQTIKKNIDNGLIRTSLEFKRDVMLMFSNAVMYNKTNDLVYNMALQMQQESINPIEILLQAQGQVDAPTRRETRTSESSSKRTCEVSGKRKRLSEENLKNKKKKDEGTT